MFHPYSVHGGTATLDPQIAGANGQSRFPEMFNPTFPQSIPGFIPPAGVLPMTPVSTAYGAPQVATFPTPTFGAYPSMPVGMPTTPFVNPYIAGGYNPYCASYPTAIPTTPFVNYATTPFVSPQTAWGYNPYASIPTNTYNPMYNPLFANPINPFISLYGHPATAWGNPTIPTFGGLHPFAVTNPYVTPYNVAPTFPTPFGNVVATTPCVTTPYGTVTINPWLGTPQSFRGGSSHWASLGSIGNPLTNPISGYPTVESLCQAACCNPISGAVQALNPFVLNSTLASGCLPFVGGFNPLASQFVPSINDGRAFFANHPLNLLNASTPHSFCGTPGVNVPWSANPLVTTTPFANSFGVNPWLTGHNPCNPYAGSFVNPLNTTGSFWNGMPGYNPAFATPFGASNPVAIPTINPISGAANPFFSPTNVAYGIPGYSMTNPVSPLPGFATSPITGVPGVGSMCCN